MSELATVSARNTLVLREATDLDWGLIRRWLNLPAVQKWWGPASATESEVIQALGADYALARIIEWRGRAVGYGHAIDALAWGQDLPSCLEPGTWEIDAFIADPDTRGIGLGQSALEMLRSELYATTFATAACVFTPIANEAGVRAYERIGFEWRQIWHDPIAGPMWLLINERPHP